jgi:hypothetical protein
MVALPPSNCRPCPQPAAEPSSMISGPAGLVSPVCSVCVRPSKLTSGAVTGGSGDSSRMMNHPSAGTGSSMRNTGWHGWDASQAWFMSRMACRNDPGPLSFVFVTRKGGPNTEEERALIPWLPYAANACTTP